MFDSPINQIGALATAKSMIYSGIISQLALKSIFGRIRPNPDLSVPCTTQGFTNNPWDFFHGSKVTFRSANGPTSMPSFHFSLYFAAGTALSQTYNSYWPYLITAAGLLPDFGSHHHWVSDMFAGAAIGTLIGYTVTNNLKNKLGLSKRETIMLEPSLEQRGVQLTYKLQFDSPNAA